MYAIHDLYIRPLSPEQLPYGRKVGLLRYSDHLLRRFGLAEMVYLEANQIRPSQIREVADEAWALLQGSVQFRWVDRRSTSPTHGAEFQFDCDQPTLVLAPFGVDFEVRAVGGKAQLVRLATHERSEE